MNEHLIPYLSSVAVSGPRRRLLAQCPMQHLMSWWLPMQMLSSETQLMPGVPPTSQAGKKIEKNVIRTTTHNSIRTPQMGDIYTHIWHYFPEYEITKGRENYLTCTNDGVDRSKLHHSFTTLVFHGSTECKSEAGIAFKCLSFNRFYIFRL